MNSFKNKTLAATLAFLGGTLGLHRFYLQGCRDKWAWLHVMALPLSLLIFCVNKNVHPFFATIPLLISMLGGFLACLVIGTTSDEKWDAAYNNHALKKSDTGWPIVVILVVTLGIGASVLIAVIARTFDLLFTGGLYG